MNNEKGIVQLLLVIGIVVALGVIGYVLFSQKLNTKTAQNLNYSGPFATQYQAAASAAPIQNSSDLNSASTSLDSADTAQIDTELNSLNSVSSGF